MVSHVPIFQSTDLKVFQALRDFRSLGVFDVSHRGEPAGRSAHTSNTPNIDVFLGVDVLDKGAIFYLQGHQCIGDPSIVLIGYRKSY